MQSQNQPTVVLVRPQLGENIGMTARAMANCGLEHLSIISPRDGWPNENAKNASCGGLEKITTNVFNSFEDALSDFSCIYSFTNRARPTNATTKNLEEAVEDIRAKIKHKLKCAVVFGPENSGLTNDEVAKSNVIVKINLNPDFSSLNLSQSVLLFAYHFRNFSSPDGIVKDSFSDSATPSSLDAKEIATQESVIHFIKRLEEALENKGYFRNPKQKPAILRNFYTYLFRSCTSKQELRTMEGVLTYLKRDSK